jgi:hypothetical protein
LDEDRPAEVRPDEVRLAEVRPLEACPAEVRLAEVRLVEACPNEVRLDEIWPNLTFFLPPCTPGIDALLEDCEVLCIGHRRDIR